MWEKLVLAEAAKATLIIGVNFFERAFILFGSAFLYLLKFLCCQTSDILRRGQKLQKNLPLSFDGTKQKKKNEGGCFKFCGLLTIPELGR